MDRRGYKGAFVFRAGPPWPETFLRGSLEGARAMRFRLPGQGQYRAIYFILEEDRVCLVFAILPRTDAYERATRRLKGLRRQQED